MRIFAATVVTIGFMFSFVSGALSAHHSFAPEFDGRVAVTLQGVIAKAEMVNPHSFIYLDVKTPEGTVEQWALEGPALRQLPRRGLGPDMFKTGEPLGVCGDKLVWSNYRQRKCDLDQ
jgi:hypothetical protein